MSNLFNRALTHIRVGNLEGGIESLKEALAKNIDDGASHGLLSYCLYHTQRIYAAKLEAEESLRLDPEYYLPYYVLGLICSLNQNYKEAENNLLEAINLDPSFTSSYCALANMHEKIEQPNNVLPLLERALEIDSEDLEVLTAFAEHYVNRNNITEAKAFLSSALTIDPEYSDALLLMGEIHLKEGKIDEAREHALLSLRQDPNNQNAISLLCGVKFRKSIIFGIWWRMNSLFSSFGNKRSICILLIAFASYKISLLISLDFSIPVVSYLIHCVWLALCAYTWVGPILFHKVLRKELESVKLNPSF